MIEEKARAALDPVHWDFFAGGAGDERTLRANRAAFDRRTITPRVLRGVGDRDLRTGLYGVEMSMPVLIAPTAFHRLAHPDGERGTARAAAGAGTVMVVSMAATQGVEEIAGEGASLFFQLYPQPDQDFERYVIRRAEDAGVRALVVTVDSPVFGRRERDLRNAFTDLPEGLCCENMRDKDGYVRNIAFKEDLSWADVDRIKAATELPVLLKGILHPRDAAEALDHGADGIIVSNHGGRQLDGAPATLDALPAVAATIDGRIPVLMDGGITRGVDVLTALALGADAVLAGRIPLWGLAASGTEGVRQELERLRGELDRAMALSGAKRPADLTPDLVS